MARPSLASSPLPLLAFAPFTSHLDSTSLRHLVTYRRAMPRNNKKPAARKSTEAPATPKAAATVAAAAPAAAAAAVAAPPAKATDSAPTRERSFIMIKPDGVHRGIVGSILRRFEERGYKLVALKQMTASREHLEEHYCDLKDKPFFPSLISYMVSGPVVAMVWQGLDIVKQGRVMLGATNPLASAPGSIRGDFSIQTGRNICHGSDSVDSANREIAHWFGPEEINDYASALIDAWVYE